MSLGILKRIDFEAEAYHSSKSVLPLNKRLLSYFTKPLPLAFWVVGGRTSRDHLVTLSVLFRLPSGF